MATGLIMSETLQMLLMFPYSKCTRESVNVQESTLIKLNFLAFFLSSTFYYLALIISFWFLCLFFVVVIVAVVLSNFCYMFYCFCIFYDECTLE